MLGSKTLIGILAGFNKLVTQLDALHNANLEKIAINNQDAEELMQEVQVLGDQSKALYAENERVLIVSGNIKQLLGTN